MKRIGYFVKSVVRLYIVWAVDGMSLLAAAALLSNISFAPAEPIAKLLIAFSAAFVLSLVNLLIRPIILMMARPLGFIAVFVIGFVVNAIALWLTAWLLPGFEVAGIVAAVVGGLVFAAINLILTSILDVNEEGSLYQNRIELEAKRDSFVSPEDQGRGLVIVEIDGLSYHHMRRALRTGQMPFLRRLAAEQGYVLSRVDCGIPSQTSSCQAGIMFGDNYDIPAYRWYDKDQQKLYVSANDAHEINARFARGNGLMREGTSIANMMNGDAAKSMFTLADLTTADSAEQRRRAQDMYLLMLNPYFLTRTLMLFFVEVGRELWQGWRQKREDVRPRLNRLHRMYPLVRAGTTILVRELGANLTILDIVRGVPAIYFTWPGYDEVAHHSGPWTKDAFGVIKKFDANLERIYDAAKGRAPRPYDLIVLSDHGQSFGATFLQRYGISLREFIEQQLPSGVLVSQMFGGDTGLGPLTAVGTELGNLGGAGGGSRVGRQVAKQGQRLIERGTEQRRAAEGENGAATPGAEKPQVVAYGSGNLAQVYFDLLPRKLTLSELNAAYPGMVEALVQHPGIGLVCGYKDDGTPVCLGKGGMRDLHTGEVNGDDPLKAYAPENRYAYGRNSVETRAWQVRRVMDFPHAGDLMVVSTVYPDGSVAAFEELIGNHGGLGGEQTDAFVFHPRTMKVPEVRNSTEVFEVLNARRGQPITPEETRAEAAVMSRQVDEWSPVNLWNGIKDVRTWVPLAMRALVLDRAAYRQVANNPRLTGPGLLLGVVLSAVSATSLTGDLLQLGYSAWSGILSWVIATIAVYIAGRAVARRGYYTRTMRTLGFAQVMAVASVLALIPDALGVILFLYLALEFVALWTAASAAHATGGWRSLLLPLMASLLATVIPLMVSAMVASAVGGVESILMQLGLAGAR